MTSPRLWVSALSLAAVLWILFHDLDERTSPGQLGATHLALAELEGSQGCDACHGESPDDLARACTVCHEEVGEELAAGAGFHGTLAVAAGAARPAEVAAEDCGACHLEHQGHDFPPVTERSFQLAGFAGRDGFDHDRLGYELVGDHAAAACVDCHALCDAAALAEGERRFGGLSQACAPCHDDPHGGRMVRACADCHGAAEAWHDLGPFAHDPAFPLEGAHALAAVAELAEVEGGAGAGSGGSTTAEACGACHEPGSPFEVEALAAGPAGGGLPTDARSCADCHEHPHDPGLLATLAEEAGSLLAPRLAASTSRDACAACHTPHPEGFGPASLAGTGLDDPAEAAALHAATGFALDAPHADLACGACHADPTALVPPPSAGGRLADPTRLPGAAFADRFPGRAARDCAACHQDPHAGAKGPGCADCHQATGPWEDLSGFAHRADWPLAGVHGAAACDACHAEVGPTSIADLGTRVDRGEPVPARACAACHEQPHDDGFLDGVARLLERPPDGGTRTALPRAGDHDERAGVHASAPADATCRACHDTTRAPAARGGPGFRIDAADLPVDLHAASGFALEPPHADLACGACHADPTALVPPPSAGAGPHAPAPAAAFADRFLAGEAARSPAACAACHADPHDGHLAASPLVAAAGVAPDPDGCRACHGDHAFAPSRVDATLHAASGFPLDGAHDAVGCFACHARDDAHPAGRFAGTPAACAACHDDVHAGAFADLELPGHAAGDCAACHTTADFHAVEAVAAGSFEHDAWCGFALEGAHAAAACAACHGPEPAGPGARAFGRVAVLTPGDPARCVTCHADPHGGAFDDGPVAAAGDLGCARCHDQASFRLDEDAPFDHGLWTGFELAGPHAAADCAACHGRTATPDGPGRLGPAAGPDCAACHGDVHLGQFREPGAATTDCARCHRVPDDPAGGWRADAFDHDAAFVLDATHAPLDCAACHRAWPLEGGGEVVRYRPLGRTCEACHGTPFPGGDR